MAKRPTRAEALRSAVDQTFQTAAGQAQVTRERAQDLVDELAQGAGRLRGALEDLRPPTGDDLRAMSSALADLERRVSALEGALGAAGRGSSSTGAARKATAAPARGAQQPAPSRRKASSSGSKASSTGSKASSSGRKASSTKSRGAGSAGS